MARFLGLMSLKLWTSHSSQVSGRHKIGPSTCTLLTRNACGRYPCRLVFPASCAMTLDREEASLHSYHSLKVK
jgi:hypothetical protein